MKTTAIAPTIGPLSTYVRGALRTGGYYPNAYDACLNNDYQIWCSILDAGGLERICRPVGSTPYRARPWVEQPDGGRAFSPIGTMLVSDFTLDTETIVLSIEIPFGYDGVINYAVANVLPSPSATSNFTEGSGQIIWRLTANDLTDFGGGAARHLRDWGNVTVSRGSMTDPSPIPNGGLRVYSRNLVKFTATLSSTTPSLNPGATILTSIMGWIYPRP